ncbi:MAG: hypothetical protein PF447_13185, partial [Spirochaetaceae bacterium]|nr:hypothetical protein [Spirochaetaceae bacterium]
MKRKNVAYLMALIIIVVSNITFLGLLHYFKQLTPSQIMGTTLTNPFYLSFFVAFLAIELVLLMRMDKKIQCQYKKEHCNEEQNNLEDLQKSIVKFP